MSNDAISPSSTPGEAEIVSWSKDSISVRWRFESLPQHMDENVDDYSGFMLRYQAVGSLVIQHTRLLDASTTDYDITQLHENTNYDICVLRVRNLESSLPNGNAIIRPVVSALLTPTSVPVLDTIGKACIKGTTSTDSLSVALGSTFGAFLALGLIVALVFVAKCQHVRRIKKRLEEAIGMASPEDGEINRIEDVMMSKIEDQHQPTDETGMLFPCASNGGELVANGNHHQLTAEDNGMTSTSSESDQPQYSGWQAVHKQDSAMIDMEQMAQGQGIDGETTPSSEQARQLVISLKRSSVLEDHEDKQLTASSTENETTPSDGDSIQTAIQMETA